jgi:hypothetical protein
MPAIELRDEEVGQPKYDWIAHYKKVQKRIALAHKFDPRPARVRLGATIYAYPIGPIRIIFLDEANLPKKRPVQSWRRILANVSREFNVPMEDLLGPRRHAPIMAARMKAYYLLREDARLSFPEIGRKVGGRDHTSALSGYRKFKKLLAEGKVAL